MTEKEMREAEVPTPKSVHELAEYVESLVKQPHDYGTCVYAMSMAAVAAFNYVAGSLGVTGFQASCADMDVLRRTRGWKHGFRILNYEDLLYPQYRHKADECAYDNLLRENADWLRKAAKDNLKRNPGAHPDVVAHWKMLQDLPRTKEESPSC